MAEIFVSYSSYDRAKAEQLVTQLETAGHSVWIDQHGIGGALNWSAEIVDAISECTTVAFLISAHSVSSENVAREIHLASEKKKNILPIIIEETQLPRIFEYPLAGLQRVRYERIEDILHAVDLLKQGHSILEQMQAPASRTSDDGYVHLAVLPFDDLSPQHDNEWFADGMMDELIGTLGALEKMRVPSRTDVLYYRTHKPKVKEIAKDLGVRYLVEGSVRKAGERIRITATLIDTHANHQIWTNRFDGNFDDIFEFQDNVSREITAALKLKLTPAEVKKITADPTQNVEAYELYLRGLEYMRRHTRDGYENGLRLMDEAIKLDENFSDAFLAKSYAFTTYYREFSRDQNLLESAFKSVTIAEQLSGETARILWMRGDILLQQGDTDGAETLLNKAISIDKNFVQSYNVLGILNLDKQNYQKAVDYFESAVSIEPSFSTYYNLLIALSSIPKDNRLVTIANYALPVMERYIRRSPDDLYAQVRYAYSLFWAGKTEESKILAEKISSLQSTDANILYNLGSLFEDLGVIETHFELISKAIQYGFQQFDVLKAIQYSDPKHSQRRDNIISSALEKKVA
jgi:TolB-like protein